MAKGSFFSLFRKNKNDDAKSSADTAVQEQESQAQPEQQPEQQPEPQPELEAEQPLPEEPSMAEVAAPDAAEICAQVTAESRADAAPQVEETQSKPSLWKRLTAGLRKTSSAIGDGLWGIFKDKKIDDELFEDLETQLLTADIGVPTTLKIVEQLTEQASRKQLQDASALYELLQQNMTDILTPVAQPLTIPAEQKGPFVILMVGVNGVGKTTTIGKLAQQFKREGKSVMLAAGDTFRAAAVEQLQVWGQRNDIPVVAQHTGADSASVIFDAVEAAKARGVDVLIADTAGRLQNKAHLMDELKKVVRVMRKLDDTAPHEVMLTLDAGTGQNAISQAKLFTEAVGVSGITLTKLDGTAKGGVIFAIADQFNIPIRYIGVGEGIDDLRPFVAKEFVGALFQRELSETETS
ncbi:signal recognition particle-docking protein FtsY [Pseudidiomarina woesei]|uniref:Signal recognition particle receptor FtsY n=1 Tax=Pseudidiomarina woesei TaxID=1381080 RepID=A0A0K6H8Y4_9GAMM|nr:signal recognition particle-docking protein FtsY [Pseudidiomarina woesei]CUA87198.1 signal recognition particle-docking protein FtsY [Pseudidiomarina woesei]